MLMAALFVQELNVFRGNCSMLFHYDWISVPLVYTQASNKTLPLISDWSHNCEWDYDVHLVK